MWETEQFWHTIDFHSIFFFPTMEVNGAPKQPGYTFFRISSFVFSRTKKFLQVWNKLRVSKWWQNFYFWVNYPFKLDFHTMEMDWVSADSWEGRSCANPRLPHWSVFTFQIFSLRPSPLYSYIHSVSALYPRAAFWYLFVQDSHKWSKEIDIW